MKFLAYLSLSMMSLILCQLISVSFCFSTAGFRSEDDANNNTETVSCFAENVVKKYSDTLDGYRFPSELQKFTNNLMSHKILAYVLLIPPCFK